MTADFQPGDTVIWTHARKSLTPTRYVIRSLDDRFVYFTDGSMCRLSTVEDDYTKVENAMDTDGDE